jgi:hypothetical protein
MARFVVGAYYISPWDCPSELIGIYNSFATDVFARRAVIAIIASRYISQVQRKLWAQFHAKQASNAGRKRASARTKYSEAISLPPPCRTQGLHSLAP